MTVQVTPPSRPSHPLRSVLIGVFICLVLPGALAACKGHVAPTEATITAAPEVTEAAPTPTPVGTTLVSLTGKGDMTSDDFQASGDSVDVAFSYDCPTDSSFTINFYGTNGSPVLPDVITDEFGTQRSDTITEPLNGATGPFHFDVTTTCSWSVKVVGAS